MGTMDEIKGRIKEAAGVLTGNKDLERDGKADSAAGKVKDVVDAARDKASDAVDAIREKGKDIASDLSDDKQ
jgi:uncharacterized protein YjbJ (UPF0337 family)